MATSDGHTITPKNKRKFSLYRLKVRSSSSPRLRGRNIVAGIAPQGRANFADINTQPARPGMAPRCTRSVSLAHARLLNRREAWQDSEAARMGSRLQLDHGNLSIPLRHDHAGRIFFAVARVLHLVPAPR